MKRQFFFMLLAILYAGDYAFELRRWPRERDAALAAGLPPAKHEGGEFPAGDALPIAKARLKIAGFDKTIDVGSEDKQVNFRMALPAGSAELQTWFLDAAGKELCGAYYVYISRQ